MGFWRLMFLMDLLIPLLMIIYGYVYSQRAPKKINTSGYRTEDPCKTKKHGISPTVISAGFRSFSDLF